MLNLLGSAIPLALALPTLAILARTLTPEQFSLVTLAWALVGFAGVFDLGLSRSITRMVSQDRGSRENLAAVLSTALAAAVGFAIVAGALLLLGREVLVHDLLKVTPAIADDARLGFLLVALSIPALLPTLIIHGFWDGLEEFVESNLQRVISGSSVPIFTATAVLITPTFTAAMMGLLAARVLALVVALTRRRAWKRIALYRASRGRLAQLLSFGGWITVSNIVGPVMGYLDRYVLGFTNSASVVAFYAAPAEAALKLLVLPSAITRGLFPKLADPSNKRESRSLLRQTYVLVSVACLPIGFITIAFASPILSMWLGQEFGARSAVTLQILMVGYVFCAYAQIPFTQCQAAGRADVTAKLHLLEVGPFLLLAFLLTAQFGIEGAATAWMLRNAADFLLLRRAAHALKP